MAGSRLNSGKKINYAKQVCESSADFKNKIVRTCEEIHNQCEKMKTAVTDRTYNNIAEIGNTLIECANAVVRTTAEDLLEPLTKDTISGAELVRQSKALLPELEACYSNKPEIVPISDSVIDGRGLEEDWTDATRAEFGSVCSDFISLRMSYILQLGDITKQCKEEDTEGIFQRIGAATENVTNNTAAAYNKLQEQLEQAGILVDQAIKQAEAAGAKIANIDDISVDDIIHGDMDV